MNTHPQHPGWLEIGIDAGLTAHEALSAFLFDIGCEGIVTESFEDPSIKAYVSFPRDLEDIHHRIELFLGSLEEIFPEATPFRLKCKRIEDRDWTTEWRRFFKPDRITEKLWVVPAWEPAPSHHHGHVIRIDPGPAFGTGQHATTRMCLRAMEKAVFPGPWNMLDIGTGSGILAVYGAQLGAERIAAIDKDPEALRWARRNIDINDLGVDIELSSKPLAYWAEHFSIVTANLILKTILDLCPYFSGVLSLHGRLIISGITCKQVREVEEKFAEQGMTGEAFFFQEEWACIIFKKTALSRK